MPGACQTQQVTSNPAVSTANPRPVPLHAGRYLAARQASYFNDVDASADFYLDALRQDERNSELLQQAFLTQYRNGNIDMAAALARQLLIACSRDECLRTSGLKSASESCAGQSFRRVAMEGMRRQSRDSAMVTM